MSFNGERLTELRLMRGLSREELAKVLGVTEQAIGQFENNRVDPKISSTLFQLVQFFHVDLSYFDEDAFPIIVNSGQIAFRNADLASKKAIKIQEAYLNAAHAMFTYLEGHLISPDWSFNQLVTRIQNEEDLEKIAAISRELLEISEDNHDLLYRLEVSGINILERLINGEADAYSLWTKDGKPYVILGKGKSAVRRNFDLAHELGHLLLHRGVDFDELDKYEYQAKEQEANRFASQFLLPKESFIKDFEQMVGHRVSNPDNYIKLKEKTHVSLQALEMRAYKLGYITQAENSYFYRTLNKKGYKKMESLDYELPIQRPTKVKSILDMIFTQHIESVQGILRNKKIRIDFLCDLFDIDKAFFEKYQQQPARFGNVYYLNGNKH